MASMAGWNLLPAFTGAFYDAPRETFYFDPRVPADFKGRLHAPVFTPHFWAWLDYSEVSTSATLSVVKVFGEPATRQIRLTARSIDSDGRNIGETRLPEPFALKPGAVLPLLRQRVKLELD